MVKLIGKVSKGSRMDQIYIPKNRVSFPIGSYVVLQQIEAKQEITKPFFYNINYLEPIKVGIIDEIFKTIDKFVNSENIIITGSFLEKGFRFNDIDIVIITKEKIDGGNIKEMLYEVLGSKFHLIIMPNKALLKGLGTDPLYRLMLSKCVSRNRLIHKVKPRINYKLADLHLLKSKSLVDNFEVSTGDEKYEMVRNLIAIKRFIDKKEVKEIDTNIDIFFGKKTVEKLKNNTIQKDFLKKYKIVYNSTKEKILDEIKNESKQK